MKQEERIKTSTTRGAFFVRARSAHTFYSNFDFLLSQVSQWRTDSNEKGSSKGREINKTERQKSSFLLLWRATFEGVYSRNVKTSTNKQTTSCILATYIEVCDTCDSKNDKTPVMRTYAYARGGGVIGLFTIHFSSEVVLYFFVVQ